MVCAFFGHRDVTDNIRNQLYDVLKALIENSEVESFYVGNQGGFDSIVKDVLKLLQLQYPQIKYSVVLAYLPSEKSTDDYSDTIYPECFESTPPKFAIAKRNRWMIEQSDIVITYVKHSWGGAAQFKALAEKKGKRVINLI